MGMQRNNLNKFVRALRCFSNEYKFLLNENIPQEELIVGFFDGKYYVDSVTHDISSGFTTKCELHKVLEGGY